MKKIIVIDGGPRKAMNTAMMVEKFIEGARSVSEDVEVKHVRLYDLDYKGCYSCMACKLKGKRLDSCAMKDGLTDILREATFADGLCLASPIYYGGVTAQLQAFIERLTFPWLCYDDFSKSGAPKRMPTAFIYTMNADENSQQQTEPGMDRAESVIGMFLSQPERVKAMNTCQVKNYDRYAFSEPWVASRLSWREQHWEQDLQDAYDAGRRMAEKIIIIK